MLVLILASIPAVLQDGGKHVGKGWETSYFAWPGEAVIVQCNSSLQQGVSLKPNDADLDELWKQ